MGLLFGKDVTLVSYDMPALVLPWRISQFFPILGPLGVRLSGGVSVSADVAFGFDTYPLTHPDADLLDGFFVADYALHAAGEPAGEDVPEVTITGFIAAAGEINVVVAQAGVEGGLFGTIDFNLHDRTPDGKVRFSEIDLSCAFDTSGRLEIKLRAYIAVGFEVFRKGGKNTDEKMPRRCNSWRFDTTKAVWGTLFGQR